MELADFKDRDTWCDKAGKYEVRVIGDGVCWQHFLFCFNQLIITIEAIIKAGVPR
jgi:hypothetical protein